MRGKYAAAAPFAELKDALEGAVVEEGFSGPSDHVDGVEAFVGFSFLEIAIVERRKVVEEAILQSWVGPGLHFDVDLGTVLKLAEDVETDAVAVGVRGEDFRVLDDSLADRQTGLDDGVDHGEQGGLALAEHSFENVVVGGIEEI